MAALLISECWERKVDVDSLILFATKIGSRSIRNPANTNAKKKIKKNSLSTLNCSFAARDAT